MGGVTVVNGTSGKIISEFGFQPASGDTGLVAVDPGNKLVYVSSCDYGLQVANGATYQPLNLVSVGGCPTGLAVDPSSHAVYVIVSASVMEVVRQP